MRPNVARIAVSGAGWWGQGWHLPHLHRHPSAAIAAIIEPSHNPRSSNAAQQLLTTDAISKQYSAPVFRSLPELISSGVELDGLLVGSPHAAHHEQTMAAIQAGLHVLVEKPMTTDVEQAKQLVAAAERHVAAGRFFAVNNTANWREAAIKAKRAVAADELGEIEHVACRMHSPLLWLFDDSANEGWTLPTGQMAGNGFAWGQLSHLLAWVFHITDLKPNRVFSTMKTSANSGADLHDAAVVCCEGGASIALSGSAAVPGDAHGEAPVGKQIEISVFGSKGTLVYGGDDQQPESGALEFRRRNGSPSFEILHPTFEFENYDPSGGGPESLDALIMACLGKEAYVGASAEVGFRTVQTIDAMYRSANSAA